MHSNPNTYIVSTKQGRFVEAILRANEVSVPPPERIFDLENKFGPKQKVNTRLFSTTA